MKTMFGRQFLLTAACILCSILILGASFRVFIQKYVQSESQKSLYQSAEAVAELASAYESIGDLENNWEFHINLSFAAEAAGTDTVICGSSGRLRWCRDNIPRPAFRLACPPASSGNAPVRRPPDRSFGPDIPDSCRRSSSAPAGSSR